MRLSRTQLETMDSLLAMDGEGDVRRTLSDRRITTIDVLREAGMLHREQPAAWGQGRMPWPLFWLTEAGKDVVRQYRAEKRAKFDALMADVR